MYGGQHVNNWEDTYLRKTYKGKKQKQEAQKTGAPTTTVQKNYAANHQVLNAKHVATILTNEEQNFEVKTISHDFKIALQQARNARGLTQKQLAQKINEKISVVQDYETGKAIPQGGIIIKLNKALDCKLPKNQKK